MTGNAGLQEFIRGDEVFFKAVQERQWQTGHLQPISDEDDLKVGVHQTGFRVRAHPKKGVIPHLGGTGLIIGGFVDDGCHLEMLVEDVIKGRTD